MRITPITEEKYWYMLEVLPPLDWTRGGFLVSEASSQRVCTVSGKEAFTYDGAQQLGDKYYATVEAVTRREWHARDINNLEIVEPVNG